MKKGFWTKLLSLIVCLAMMCAAALTVNKTLVGHTNNVEKVSKDKSEEKSIAEIITKGEDGMVIVHTRALTDMDGYAGPVPLDVYFRDGKIEKVDALDNSETPGFFKRASVLLEAWDGKSAEEAEKLKVDAVSGATYTSNAIIGNVRAAAAYMVRDSSAGKTASGMPWKEWVALGVILCACVFPLFVKNKYYRYVQLIANVAVLGFWCGQFLDYSLMLKYLSSGFSFPIGFAAILMLLAAFIYPLFGKPQHY